MSSILRNEAERTGRIVPLDDRRIPGSRANIDHIAVAPAGVFVIDSKKWAGKVERAHRAATAERTEHMVVKGRLRDKAIDGVNRQISAVRTALSNDFGIAIPTVVPVLCFVGEGNWGEFDPAFTVSGVHVRSRRELLTLLRSEGALRRSERTTIARLLSVRLLPKPSLPRSSESNAA